jgi:membrane-associated phospholipid phosphatase
MYRLLHDLDWVLLLRSPLATAIFTGFTWTGYAPFVMILLPLGYWAWNKHAFTRVALFVFISAVLNAALKQLFQDPRPDAIYRLDSQVGGSYGLPSGHAQTAVVLWFWLAHEVRRKWFRYLALAMVVGVCLSRLYLGVHDLEDVLAGVAVGGLCLGLFRWTLSPAWDRWRNLYWIERVGIVLLVEAVVFALWPGGLTSGILQTGGILIGWFAAAACERIYFNYQPIKSPWRLITSCVLGISSVYLLFVVKDLMGTSGSVSVMSFLMGAYMGIHIALIMPIVFVLLRLATKTSKQSADRQTGNRIVSECAESTSPARSVDKDGL